jgi:hypothetical protein
VSVNIETVRHQGMAGNKGEMRARQWVTKWLNTSWSGGDVRDKQCWVVPFLQYSTGDSADHSCYKSTTRLARLERLLRSGVRVFVS